MLSEDLRNAVRALQGECAVAGLPSHRLVAICNHFVELEDLADRLESWERAAIPGPAARLDRAAAPANVVFLQPKSAA